MAARQPDQRRIVATIAAIRRHHPDADVSDLLAELRFAGLAETLRRAVTDKPSLTAAQRARLVGILRQRDAA